MPRIRVAKTGYTVDADPRHLALDTNKTSVMVYDEPLKADGVTSHTHNLGYYPIVYPFFHDGSGNWHPQNSLAGNYSDIEQDANTIYITNDFGQETKLFILGNAVDNATGSGKNTATGKIRVAKTGYNAATETDIRRFQFCSGLDLFKKVGTGSISFTTDDDYFWEQEKSVAHGRGYVPFVAAIDYAGTLGLGGELPLDFAEFNNFYFYVNATHIVFGVSVLSKDPEVQTYTFRYNIYANKIA